MEGPKSRKNANRVLKKFRSRTASKHVYYLGWNRSPVQVGCMRQALGPGALGRPRGIGWRGRWEGGSGWGTHVNPWLIHFSVWQNPLQLKKKKFLSMEIGNGEQVRLCDGLNKISLIGLEPYWWMFTIPATGHTCLLLSFYTKGNRLQEVRCSGWELARGRAELWFMSDVMAKGSFHSPQPLLLTQLLTCVWNISNSLQVHFS